MKIAEQLQAIGKQLEQREQDIRSAEQEIANKRAWVERAQSDLNQAQAAYTETRAAYAATHAELQKLTGNLVVTNIITPAQPPDDILNSPIDDVLELTPRSSNCLKAEGVKTIGELNTIIWKLKPGEICNLGRKSIDEIKQALAEKGLWAEP